MRFIGVLLGSLVASAVLVGAWVWTGATAGMERQACPQTAAAAIAVVAPRLGPGAGNERRPQRGPVHSGQARIFGVCRRCIDRGGKW